MRRAEFQRVKTRCGRGADRFLFCRHIRKPPASARRPLQTDFLLLIERWSDIRGSRGRADRDARHHSSATGRLSLTSQSSSNQRRPPSPPPSAGVTRLYVPQAAFPAGCVTSSAITLSAALISQSLFTMRSSWGVSPLPPEDRCTVTSLPARL